jgi:hypothetical protein
MQTPNAVLQSQLHTATRFFALQAADGMPLSLVRDKSNLVLADSELLLPVCHWRAARMRAFHTYSNSNNAVVV